MTLIINFNVFIFLKQKKKKREEEKNKAEITGEKKSDEKIKNMVEFFCFRFPFFFFF